MVWWMSGVVDVWCGGCLFGGCRTIHPDHDDADDYDGYDETDDVGYDYSEKLMMMMMPMIMTDMMMMMMMAMIMTDMMKL